MSAPPTPPSFLDTDQHLGRAVVLTGAENGKYPSGNTLLVRGSEETVLIDPSVSVARRGGAPVGVDRVMVSHAHEDHMVGLHRFATAEVHAHHDDLLGLQSTHGFKTVYGMPPEIEDAWFPQMVEEFEYTERPDATGFADGQVFELGEVRIEIVHLPGHTRGHSGFLVEPDGVFFVADVDLSSFGPYYGDHWSNLEDFVRAIERCRQIEARWYVTFHHKGVVEGRDEFLRQLDAFAAVIDQRDARLLEFLAEPRTIDEIVAHRFVYRPGVDMPFVDVVERRSMTMHLERLLPLGGVIEVEPGRYRAA